MTTRGMILAATVMSMALLLGASPRPCRAEPLSLGDYASAFDRALTAPDGERVVLGHASRQLQVPVETLRLQRLKTGLTLGNLLVANRLAQLAKVPVEQIVTESRGGQSWEDIARAHAVNVDQLRDELKFSREAVEQRLEDKAARPYRADEPVTRQPAPPQPGVGPQIPTPPRRY
jgi:hypothetical protein